MSEWWRRWNSPERKGSLTRQDLPHAASWLSGPPPAPASLQLWHPLSHASLLTAHGFPVRSCSPLLGLIQWLPWTKDPLWSTVPAGHADGPGCCPGLHCPWLLPTAPGERKPPDCSCRGNPDFAFPQQKLEDPSKCQFPSNKLAG